MKKRYIGVVAISTITTALALASCGKKNKDDLDELAKQIIVSNDGDKVTSDFKLPSYVAGKKTNYKLEWTTNDSNLLNFVYIDDDPETEEDESLEDCKAKVTRPTDANKEVEFYATITDGKKSAQTATFTVRVQKAVTPEEQYKQNIDDGAANKKTNVTLGGYVIKKAGWCLYNGAGECALYIVDENYTDGAYYIYNSKISEADYNSIEVGDYVSVESTQMCVYSGTIEAQFGTVVVDKTKKMSASDIAAKTIDITNDIVNGTDITYKQAHIATLTGAKVTEVSEKQTTTAGKYLSTTQTVFKCDVNGTEVKVTLSQGLTPFDADATKTLYDGLKAKVAVGDYINIKGAIVNNTTLAVDSVEDVVISTTTPSWGKIAETIDEITISNFTSAGEQTLPTTGTTYSDVAISWAIKGTSTTVSIANGKLVGIPTKTEEEVVVVATFTVEGATVTKEYKIVSILMTPEEQVAYEAEKLNVSAELAQKELPLVGSKFKDVNITWKFASADDSNWAKIVSTTKDGATSYKVVFLDVDASQNVNLVATFTYGEASTTKTYEYTIVNEEQVISTTADITDLTKTYQYGFYQSNLGTYCFFTGEVETKEGTIKNSTTKYDQSFLKTTTNPTEAINVTVTKVGEKYTLSFKSGDATKYIALTEGVNSSNKATLYPTISDTAYEFTYNSSLNTFTGSVDVDGTSTEFYIGTYNNFTTGSCSATSYAATSVVSHLQTAVKDVYTREQKAAFELSNVTAPTEVASEGKVSLSPIVFDGVEFTYEVTDDTKNLLTVSGNELIAGVADEDTDVKVKIIAKCNGVELKSDEVIISIKRVYNYKYVTEAVAGKENNTEIVIKGIVTSIYTVSGKNPYCWITDGTTNFEVYGNLSTSSTYAYTDLAVGDLISVCGNYVLFNSTHEVSAGALIMKKETPTNEVKSLVAANTAKTYIKSTYNDGAIITLPTANTVTGATYAWAVKSSTTNKSSISDGKLLIVQDDAVVDTLVLTLTVTIGTYIENYDVTITVDANTATTKTVVAAVPPISSNVTMNDSDYAAMLGLNDEVFNVTATKNSANQNVALNAANSDIRLYGAKVTDSVNDKQGTTLTIAVEDGYVIESIKVSFGSNVATLAVNGVDNTVSKNNSKTFAINAQTVTLQDTVENKTDGIYIKSIEITYSKVS